MKAEYTPGPWEVKNEGHYFRNNAIYGSAGKQLTAAIYGANKEECVANARLISAAPDMLELLEQLYSDYDRDKPIITRDKAEQIEALINKAKGL